MWPSMWFKLTMWTAALVRVASFAFMPAWRKTEEDLVDLHRLHYLHKHHLKGLHQKWEMKSLKTKFMFCGHNFFSFKSDELTLNNLIEKSTEPTSGLCTFCVGSSDVLPFSVNTEFCTCMHKHAFEKQCKCKTVFPTSFLDHCSWVHSEVPEQNGWLDCYTIFTILDTQSTQNH